MCFHRSLCTFFLSDKKCILLKCAHKFFMRIFRIYAHLGVSIQSFFYAIFQNAHTNRWMETQLVSPQNGGGGNNSTVRIKVTLSFFA